MNPASERNGISPARGPRARTTARRPRPLVIGGLCSLVFLGGALTLQAQGSSILKLPTQWLAVAALPVLIGLMIGGYIGKFSFAGVEVEAPPLKDVIYVAQVPRSASDAETPVSGPSWTRHHEDEYARTHGLELVHIYQPSEIPGQRYDISVYITRHIKGRTANQTSGFADIAYAEFFFGPSWGNNTFTAQNEDGTVGVNTSAWGSFLAICRVTFRTDSEPVLLQRYIDYEMASA